MNPNLTALYELLLDQQKSLRYLTLQIEGLKAMMFEHKPPFIQAHAAQVERLTYSAQIRALDQRIALVEGLLDTMREPVA